MIRPSSFPALKQCPCFEGGQASVDADKGTERHSTLASLLNGDNDRITFLDDEDAESVRWAREYIELNAPMVDYPLVVEQRVQYELDGIIISGTPDYVCGSHIFDLKTRPRDYKSQMAAYAMHFLEIRSEVTVHLMYCATRHVEKFTLTQQQCLDILNPILDASTDPNRKPNPCDYCGWCARQLTCEAINDRAKAVVAGRSDWELETYQTSFITDPFEMSKALRVARMLGKWVDSVEFHAKEMWVKEGKELPGFLLKERKGKSYIVDVVKAYQLLGLPESDFLKCCDVRMNTSKTNPEKVGVVDTYKKAHNITLSGAKKAVAEKLESVIQRGKNTVSIVAEKSTEESEEENG